MKTLWLKICGGIILGVAVLVVFWVGIFRSSDQQSQPVIESTKSGQPAAVKPTTEQESEQRVEKLYKMAERVKNSTAPSERKYRIMAEYCRQIIERYPNSPKAEMASQGFVRMQANYKDGL